VNLRNRWMLLAVIASLAVVAMACGGDSPSSDRDLDDVIVLTPTPAEVNCLNGTYPDDAPAFGDDSTVAYETIDSGVGVFKREIGEGTAIKVNSNVRVHYTGFFADGCIFDTTRTRVTEASFQMSGLIQGWQIGMADMKEGGKRRIKIPPEVGYGAAGLNISGFVIPGNATLIFEVELVEVVE
jgi:FKBP-type peptidyl-prolyl cis-trans isomerase FkpA